MDDRILLLKVKDIPDKAEDKSKKLPSMEKLKENLSKIFFYV